MSNPDDLQQFIASMPNRYAVAFESLDIQQHARIARARGQQLAHVGQFLSLRHRGTALCIVAADRPGLLATISAALTLVGLGVLEAEIFTRRVSTSLSEAVDLFWVCRTAPLQNLPITPVDVRRLGQCLVDQLRKSESAPPARPSAFYRHSAESSTRIHFMEDSEGRFTTLEVEANDRSGLLLAICQGLFAAKVQIVGSRIKTHGERAQGRFELVELNERPIAADRRHEIQLAVLSAIDELPRAAAPSIAG